MRGRLPELVDCLPHFPDFVLELADQRVRGHLPELVDCLRGGGIIHIRVVILIMVGIWLVLACRCGN